MARQEISRARAQCRPAHQVTLPGQTTNFTASPSSFSIIGRTSKYSTSTRMMDLSFIQLCYSSPIDVLYPLGSFTNRPISSFLFAAFIRYTMSSGRCVRVVLDDHKDASRPLFMLSNWLTWSGLWLTNLRSLAPCYPYKSIVKHLSESVNAALISLGTFSALVMCNLSLSCKTF